MDFILGIPVVASAFIAENTGQLRGIDQKLDCLMAAYLKNAVSPFEYQIQKNKLMECEQQVKDKTVSAIEEDFHGSNQPSGS